MDPSLSIGLSALLTAQKNLDITGHNIANQATPNYSRQRVNQTSVAPSRIGPLASGMGVRIVNIQAIRDALVDRALLAGGPAAGAAERRSQILTQVESLFSTDPDASLGQSIADFFNSFEELSRNPGGSAERGAVLHNAQALAAGFNTAAEGLLNCQRQLVPQIENAIGEVNRLTSDIASRNAQIRDTTTQGGDANDLVDQRFTLIRQLAELAPVDVLDNTLGRLDVRCGGQLLVAGDRALELTTRAQGSGIQIFVGTSSTRFQMASGQLGALTDLADRVIPGYRQRLDTLAGTVAREVNRVQATGVGRGGSFTALHSHFVAADPNLALSQCGLPFPIEAGTLTVSIINQATGDVTQSHIAFDPSQDSFADIAARLDAVAGIRATAAGGSLAIVADAGYAFDFTSKVPTQAGALGGSAVTLGGAVALDADGTYTFAVDASRAVTVASIAGDTTLRDLSGGAEGFRLRVRLADGSYATSSDLSLGEDYSTGHTLDEFAADLNAAIAADPTVAGKVEAYVDGTRVGFRSRVQGAASSVQILDPTAGTTALGADHILSGFTAGQSQSADLTIGSTPGLAVTVRDATGATVATLDVGEGYTPGQALELPGGITAAFGAGTVTGAPAESLSVALTADPDKQGLLAALGLNTLFRGSTAGNLGVEPDIEADPSLIAAARSAAPADNSNALRFAALEGQTFESLGGTTIDDSYAQILGQAGLDAQMALRARDGSRLLLEAAENQRDALSAVSQDEEAVNLLRFQQAYQLAARYLRVIQDMTDLLMQL